VSVIIKMGHIRTCTRCNKDYITTSKFGKVCDECSMSRDCINKRKKKQAHLNSLKSKGLYTLED